MNQTLLTMLKGALAVGAVTAGFIVAAPARAQVEVVVDGPSADYIATTDPVYYEGHAAYWYGGGWFYRDGGSWHHYRSEPGFLHDWRGHHEFAHHYYGRAHGGGYRGNGGRGGSGQGGHGHR
jgi:hypothetical protein